MEEAEYLADETIVMASGQVVASGTNVELKSVVGSERVVIDCGGQESLEKVIAIRRPSLDDVYNHFAIKE